MCLGLLLWADCPTISRWPLKAMQSSLRAGGRGRCMEAEEVHGANVKARGPGAAGLKVEEGSKIRNAPLEAGEL